VKTTNKHKKYWQHRKIDWKTSYSDTYDHPHRYFLASILNNLKWISLFEIGCGSGANLIHFIKTWKGRQYGGVDINKDAIETAEKLMRGAILKVGSGDDVPLSDDMADIILTDMMLIYVGSFKIKAYLDEIKRLGRNYAVMCEFHSESWWERRKIKWKTGYNVYNYKKLLKKNGFYDIITIKLPKEAWPGGVQEKNGYIIISKIPKYV